MCNSIFKHLKGILSQQSSTSKESLYYLLIPLFGTVKMGMLLYFLGCGVNVNNYNPTACVNELIQQYNKTQDANLHLLTPEQLIARTVTCIEQFVEVFQSKREDEFLEKYYSRWMHE